jgi:hypothetical protein
MEADVRSLGGNISSNRVRRKFLEPTREVSSVRQGPLDRITHVYIYCGLKSLLYSDKHFPDYWPALV